MTNGFTHHYQLDEFTFNFRGVRSDFEFFISFFDEIFLCKQPQMGCHVLRHNICGYTVCLGPIKRMPGLNEFNVEEHLPESGERNLHLILVTCLWEDYPRTMWLTVPILL